MAWKMKLIAPYQGMPYIWNVSQHVGINSDCPNLVDDLELVQRLLVERLRGSSGKGRAAGITPLTNTSGTMDNSTAFWILATGDKTLEDASKISPARGGTISFGSGLWTIGYLNWKVFNKAPQVWANLPDICSPMLKTALLTKTWP